MIFLPYLSCKNTIMKVLFVDTAVDGHHYAYMRELIDSKMWEANVALPERVEGIIENQYIYKPVDFYNKTPKSFWNWMKEIRKYADEIKPDVIHFLMGDVFYKYFGMGLLLFGHYKTVVTMHWIRNRWIEKLSLMAIAKQTSIVVVHSKYLKNQMTKLGIKNCRIVEYPQFKRMESKNNEDARSYWKLENQIPVILSVGNTRFDKGLDILLDAMKYVDKPCQILIVGKAEAFDQTFINEKKQLLKHRVVSVLRYLTDDEIEKAIYAADIIALPYRSTFNGASGPLGEGVSCDKCIVGSAHGNLGATITENHLGYVFEDESPINLSKAITKALSSDFLVDEKYLEYKAKLDPRMFVKEYNKIYHSIKG